MGPGRYILQWLLLLLVSIASKDRLSDMEFKRATHAVTEIERSIRSRNILKQGNYQEFGQMMTESHYSLR